MVREYDDRTYRAYSKSSAKHREIDIPFNNLSKANRDVIETFFNANWNLEIYLYVWPEATAVDSGGTATTGRHLARFGGDPELAFTNNSGCSYNCTLTFILLS